MNTSQREPTGRFDLLGNQIFTHDLVSNILLDDFSEHGTVSAETLQIEKNDCGDLIAVDQFGTCIAFHESLRLIVVN